jgi:ankyrin repeat protein
MGITSYMYEKTVNLLCKEFKKGRSGDVNARDDLGKTALMYSSENGLEKSVETILEVEGIDVNAIDCSSKTALMYASENGQYEIVELLLKVEGIDVNAKDCSSKTALFCAYEKLLKNGH